MTLILGVEDPVRSRSFLFADTGIWRKGDAGAQLMSPELWRQGEWICGAAGDWELVQATQRIELPAIGQGYSQEAVIGLLNSWQEDVYRRCGVIAALVKGVDGEARFSTPAIVIAYEGMVFDCEDMSTCRTTLGFAAAGYWNYAYGAMGALKLAACTPEQAGRTAMKAVDSVTDGVRGPFIWACTDGTEGTFE